MTANYDRRKLIILRAALIPIGGAVGYLAISQYFVYFPDIVRREYQIVISVVCTLLTALLFFLSAKPIYSLASSVKSSLLSLGESVGARGIAALSLAAVCAVGFSVLFDWLIKRALDIWAVRLVADISVCLFFVLLFSYAFTKLFSGKRPRRAVRPCGYLIKAECFTDPRVVTAAMTLINCKVCDGAYTALCRMGGDEGKAALARLDGLVRLGKITVVPLGNEFSDDDVYSKKEVDFALNKKLLTVSAGGEGITLVSFTQPDTAMLEKLSSAQKIDGQNEDGDQINGQIIIDK